MYSKEGDIGKSQKISSAIGLQKLSKNKEEKQVVEDTSTNQRCPNLSGILQTLTSDQEIDKKSTEAI